VKALLNPEFVDAFRACKQQEQDGFGRHISAFELATYRLSV